ncbi:MULTISPECIES: hypothetical protein [unclassified Bradyrhizobium]|uniref:hypothetical protein n=1 Tax=unclassified Bradyrhizobium TaxID=2631580 RepID=UPI003399803F
MANLRIVNARVDPLALSRLRALKFGREIEALVTPDMVAYFKQWLKEIAIGVAQDWPRKTGRSATMLPASSRTTGNSLDSLRGYFLVSQEIAVNEYGSNPPAIFPKKAKKLAIPILDGCFPDGQPKRKGPLSWKSLGSFVYKSKKNNNVYIAYKSKTDGKLKLLYLLVDAVKLKEQRIIRNAYDRRLPELMELFVLFVQDAVVQVYNQQFQAALDSIDPQLKMRKVPSVVPSAELHGERLVPKY